MKLLYGSKEALSLDHIVDVTQTYCMEHIDRFQEKDLTRLSSLAELKNLNATGKQRFQDCTSIIDKTMMFSELKVETVTALASLLLLKQSSIMKLTTKELVHFACYLTERPLELYPKLAVLFGKKELLDALFQRSDNYFEQRSIFAYMEDESNRLKIDCQNHEDVLKYQEEMKQFLLQNDLSTILEKTNYQKELRAVQDSLEQIIMK